jgi:tRNA (adenine57-N1/adenine58-N1)-methyltransferase
VIVFVVRRLLPASSRSLTSQNRESMIPLTITPGEHLHNKYGRYSHDSMIGQKFGTKVGNSLMPGLTRSYTPPHLTPATFTCSGLRPSCGHYLSPIAHKSST